MSTTTEIANNTLTESALTPTTTITFQTNFPPPAGSVYTEAGLNFTNSNGNQWCNSYVNNFVGTCVSPSQFTVTTYPNSTFHLISLQGCNKNTAIPAQTITFTGTKPNGETVSQSFTTPAGSIAPQTFQPTGFIGLKSLLIHLGSVAFDNLVFNSASIKTVKFQEGFPAGCPSPVAAYIEAGLTFTNSSGNQWCSPLANNFVGLSGDSPGYLTVVPGSGQNFDFKALQVCNINADIPPQRIVFTGTKPFGRKVSQSFTTPGNNTAPQTFAPAAGFGGLTSLDVSLGLTAFDNFVFSGPR